MRQIIYLIVIFFFTTISIMAQSEENDIFLTPVTNPGFYQHRQKVIFDTNADKVYYTTDGSMPGRHSKKYKKYIRIKKTTALRILAVKDGIPQEYNFTYFIKEDTTKFLTVSLTVDPSYLFSYSRGVFRDGPNIRRDTKKKSGANYWSRKESKAHIEIFEPNGQNVMTQDLGIRLFGGFSRQFPQKSLVLEARTKYGKKRMKYSFFGKGNGKKFKTLVLRNSGSDCKKSHFRDAMMTDIVKDWDLDIQRYRPAQVYINGKYWGVYNVREKLNKNYIKQHFDLAKDNIDLLEGRGEVNAGTKESYSALLDFINKNDLSIDSNYIKVQSMMDVQNYALHQIAEIYYDNTDASGNVKYWREHKPGGKFRWMLYDTDFGMGLWNDEAYKVNTLEQKTDATSRSWPNPTWSTLILRKLLKNKDFEQFFVNRFMDVLNDDFGSENVLSSVEYFENMFKPELKRHWKKWKLRKSRWKEHIETMKTFAEKRPEFMRSFLTEMFDLGEAHELKISLEENGTCLLNQNLKFEADFEGTYFENQLLQIQAIPKDGYIFSHWEGISNKTKDKANLSFRLRQDLSLKPIYSRLVDILEDKIVINEISTNNHNSEDWIELYNTTDDTLNLTGWIFMDSKHRFVLPFCKIAPKGYLVLCQNAGAYAYRFPEVDNFVGDFSFGLNRSMEKIQLFSSIGALIDVVDYKFNTLESSYTMSLLLPNLDNGLIDNWEIRKGVGTPNRGNPYYLESKISEEKTFYVNVGISVGIGALIIFLLFAYRKETPRIKVVSQKNLVASRT